MESLFPRRMFHCSQTVFPSRCRYDELNFYSNRRREQQTTFYEHLMPEGEDTPAEDLNQENCIWACQYCGKTFKTAIGKQNHERLHTHTPRQCNKCGTVFTNNFNLRRHMMTHEDKRESFKCDLCGRSFTRKDNLRFHQKTHNKSPLKSS